MQFSRTASHYSVTVTPDDIEAFAASWPCCHIPSSGPIVFEFADDNGDIVDIQMLAEYDGPDLVALCTDAQLFASQHYYRAIQHCQDRGF